MPPPEFAEEGVYCENGCHTIEAEWKRAKSEVMPPKSSVDAAWKVASFGGFEDSVEGVKQSAKPDAGASKSAGVGGNGAKASKPEAKAEVKSAAAAKSAPDRTPFGRGPKGKQGRR